MTTANLKIDLINKITEIQDSNIIKEIKRMIDFELEEGIFQLNTDQTKRILVAQQEVKKKQYKTEDSANKEINEWLDK